MLRCLEVFLPAKSLLGWVITLYRCWRDSVASPGPVEQASTTAIAKPGSHAASWYRNPLAVKSALSWSLVGLNMAAVQYMQMKQGVLSHKRRCVLPMPYQ